MDTPDGAQKRRCRQPRANAAPPMEPASRAASSSRRRRRPGCNIRAARRRYGDAARGTTSAEECPEPSGSLYSPGDRGWCLPTVPSAGRRRSRGHGRHDPPVPLNACQGAAPLRPGYSRVVPGVVFESPPRKLARRQATVPQLDQVLDPLVRKPSRAQTAASPEAPGTPTPPPQPASRSREPVVRPSATALRGVSPDHRRSGSRRSSRCISLSP